MDNILPPFGHQRHHHSDDLDQYGRRVHSRPTYGPGYNGGSYEYTGQPVGFEHLGSPPKQRLEDMDARTIAQLGYEGPEGERRKVEAINEQIYEREHEREGYRNGVPIGGYRGYSDGYGRDRHNRHGGHIPRYEDEYRRGGRHGDPYDSRYGGRPVVPIPVTVERKYEEDGTVVENVYPDNSAAALYSRPDHGKIHYGRQDSFPETALQEAADSARRHERYAGRYPQTHYSDATSSYGRRPYEGSSSDYMNRRHY